MRALNKKLTTLAFATCLTVGMGAVAYADTVDLGYGLYGSTSSMVKAVEVMCIFLRMQIAKSRAKINFSVANKAAVDTINTSC
ncbi:MAG: hypothetical protein ACLRZ2_09490 [Veillonella sp.]